MPIYGNGRGSEPDGCGGPETPPKVWSMGSGFWSTHISKMTFLRALGLVDIDRALWDLSHGTKFKSIESCMQIVCPENNQKLNFSFSPSCVTWGAKSPYMSKHKVPRALETILMYFLGIVYEPNLGRAIIWATFTLIAIADTFFGIEHCWLFYVVLVMCYVSDYLKILQHVKPKFYIISRFHNIILHTNYNITTWYYVSYYI